MTIHQVYQTWRKRVAELRPNEHKARIRNCAWLIAAIFESGEVDTRRIAERLPGPATTNSKMRRIWRFLENNHVQVRDWYEPLARDLLAQAAASKAPLYLLVDGTKVGNGHQLLMVALAYRRRALPIAWTWVKGSRGHSSSYKQCALLAYVCQLLPPGVEVILVGDSEFGAVPLMEHCEVWDWGYILRQKGSHQVKLQTEDTWRPFDSLVQRGEQARWCAQARLTREHAYRTNLLALWLPGEAEPWLLATNLPTARVTRRGYKKRMWVEEMFGDFKGHGFDLESSRLQHFLRLSRLTLLIALLYLWLVTQGARTIKRGQRWLVDRRDRRDLSIFSIGRSMIHRWLANAHAFRIHFVPYF